MCKNRACTVCFWVSRLYLVNLTQLQHFSESENMHVLYCAGDFERDLKLPVSKMCDRYASSLVQVQLGMLIDFCVCMSVIY